MNNRLILSLCDYSGVWSRPYVEAGYRVVRVDLDYHYGTVVVHPRLFHVGGRIGQNDFDDFLLRFEPWGVLAAPPCTTFCRPGAQHWFKMDFNGQTAKDVATFRACRRICQQAKAWWALENPPGRHKDVMPELGKPAWQFQPWEFGDPWSKQTYIWGTARKPEVTAPVEPEPTRRTPNGKTQGRIAFMSSTAKRAREQTPAGFAKAFFEANR